MAICIGAALAACEPTLEPALGVVTAPVVVAVVAEPPEAAPGEAVIYTAHVMTPTGIGDGATTDKLAAQWAYCTEAKPPLEDNAVPRSCLQFDAQGEPSGDARLVIGAGAVVATTLPADACRLFGPDLPPGGLRPRDPDASGGFYQPIVITPSLTSFSHRLRCGLPTAPPAIDREFRTGYRANRNPIVHEVVVRALGDDAYEITLAIPASSAESYLLFDPISRTLRDELEALAARWWVTAGTLAQVATIPDELVVQGAAGLLTTSLRLTASPSQFPLTIGVVVTDSRGGTQFASLALQSPP